MWLPSLTQSCCRDAISTFVLVEWSTEPFVGCHLLDFPDVLFLNLRHILAVPLLNILQHVIAAMHAVHALLWSVNDLKFVVFDLYPGLFIIQLPCFLDSFH